MEKDTKENLKNIATGDLVRLEIKIKEGGKERIQAFEGTVLQVKGVGDSQTFTVRKIGSGGIGVERIWPLISPSIAGVKILKKRPQKKAKIFHLRNLKGKEATGTYL